MKALKKLSCVLLAVLLVMSLSVTAFAAGANVKAGEAAFDITIQETVKGHEYKAYQIFSGDLVPEGDAGTLSNITWGTDITPDGQEALCKAYGVDSKDPKAAALVAEAIKEKDLATMNTTLAPDGKPNDAYLQDPVVLTQAEEGVSNYATTGKVAPGYYLIVDTANPKDVENYAVTDYIVQVVGNVSMKPKADVPSVEKKVQDDGSEAWEDSADYNIGDMVPFRLTATLPSNYEAYKSYKLVFHDEQSAGLTFDVLDMDNVKVYVDGTQLAAGTYSVQFNTGDGCTFEVLINDLKTAAPSAGVGSKVVVTYSAKLNESAKIGSAGNPNTVKLEYSNNPNSEGTGHTPEDKVTVFTFQLEVNKVRPPEGTEEGNQALEGAGFTLYRASGTDAEGKTVWEAVGPELKGDGMTTFNFAGLDDGRYKIEETTTPPGFNTIDPIYFTVTAVHDADSPNPQLTKLDVVVTDEAGETIEDATDKPVEFTCSLADGKLATTIVNQSGLELPETGGIGTTIFYTVGGILVAVALILLVTKKRMTKES